MPVSVSPAPVPLYFPASNDDFDHMVIPFSSEIAKIKYIVDGASTDGTLEIIQKVAKYAKIKYISKQ